MRVKKCGWMCSIFGFVLVLWANSCWGQVDLPISANDTGRIFEGVGAASGGGGVSRLLINYPEPARSQILDYLFKPNYGASLQLLKVEIGGDGNSTEGSEPSHMHNARDENYDRGFEWWIMKEAKRRNPDIKLIALAWDFPGWLQKADSDATAEYLARYVEGAKRVQGLDIDYIGMWNETKMPYDFVGRLKKALAARHLSTKIIADDSVNDWNIADAMKKDRELWNDVDVVATHYPKFKSSELAKNVGKSIWSSEDGPWSDTWGTAGEQAGPYAEVLNRNYVQGRMTSTSLWCLVSAYYDILDIPHAGLMRAETPWSGHYEVMSPLWITAHTTQFAHPGWQYLDNASGLLPNGGSYVTLKHESDFSVIVESIAAVHPQQLTLTIDPAFPADHLAVWKTNPSAYFEQLKPLTPKGGKVSLTVEPNSVYSVTNTTGQHKGDTASPPSKAFSLPYHDTFEGYRVGNSTPRYFIEQNGAYETALCAGGRKGKCLRQFVNQSPIVWTSGTTADLLGTASIIGDKLWSNYKVSADFYLEEPGYSRIMGRVSRVTLDGQINGYQLYMHSDGRWELRTATKDGVIASGQFTSPLKTWHRAQLTFRNDTVTASIDGHGLAKVKDARYSHGMAGLGNGWNVGQYDNFTVEKVRDAPLFTKEKFAPATKAPDAPQLYVPTPLSQSVRLSWSDVPEAMGYRVKFGTSKDTLTKSIDMGKLQAYRVTTLTNGTKYFFAVVAYNEKGESAASGVQEATPQGTP